MPLVSDWTYIGTIFFPMLLKRLFRTFYVIAPRHAAAAAYRKKAPLLSAVGFSVPFEYTGLVC